LDCAHLYSSVHSHPLVCALVFLDCAQVSPNIPRLDKGFQRYSETLRGFTKNISDYSLDAVCVWWLHDTH